MNKLATDLSQSHVINCIPKVLKKYSAKIRLDVIILFFNSNPSLLKDDHVRAFAIWLQATERMSCHFDSLVIEANANEVTISFLCSLTEVPLLVFARISNGKQEIFIIERLLHMSNRC